MLPLDAMVECPVGEVMDDPTEGTPAKAVEAARSGDRAALARLVETLAPVVRGIVLSRVPTDRVPDVVHDALVRVLRGLPALRDPTAAPAWIARIARRCAADYHRHAPRTVVFDEQRDVPPGAAEDDGRAEEILELVRSLPRAYAETLLLRFVEGMTGPEIAARTGMTHGSVRVNLSRGMKLLRQRLGRRG